MTKVYTQLPLLRHKKMKDFTPEQLQEMAQELREKIINAQSTNGFLGSCLGVVDITLALHHVFDTTTDQLFWDVGHQTIPHRFISVLSDEKNEDAYSDILLPIQLHQCQYKRPAKSLSEAIGAVIHRDLEKKEHDIVCVIGDRSLSCGQAFEALNHLGAMASKMIVILNDNTNAVSLCNTAMDNYLQQLCEQKNIYDQHSLFENLGFNYMGPVDGHNFEQMIEALSILKNSKEKTPTLLHIKTKKGKGFAPAEADNDGLNALIHFNVDNGISKDVVSQTSGHRACRTLIQCAENDPKIVLLSLHAPHMHSPFLSFKEKFPDRFFEVGVTESHAITLSASLANAGFKPFIILYSSFLHRVLDHSVVDLCLKSIPVRFIIDHTRFTGHDFQCESKLFDSNFLSYLPNLQIMSPGTGEDVDAMIRLSVADQTRPNVIRLSKTMMDETLPFTELNNAHILKNGKDVAILSYGGLLSECLQAAELLDVSGYSTSVVDVRFLKPLDEDSILSLAKNHRYIISVEENAMGGFANHILQFLNNKRLLNGTISYMPIYVQKHTTKSWSKTYSINAKKIFQDVSTFIKSNQRDDDFISVA